MSLERLRPGGRSATVVAAVGVSDLERARGVSLQQQLAAVGGSVVRSANADQIGCRMSATFGAELEMVHVEISRVPAAADLATPLVA